MNIIKYTEEFIRSRQKDFARKNEVYPIVCISELRALALYYSNYESQKRNPDPDVLDCIEI